MKKTLLGGALAAALALVGCVPETPVDPGTTTTTTTPPVGATPTRLDPGFGADGVKIAALSVSAIDRFLSIASAPDGSVYGAGFATVGTNDQAFAVAKFTAAGVLDPSFNGGVSIVNVAVGGTTLEQARSVAVQPDGKVVIGGPAEKDPTAAGNFARDIDPAVVRFNTDGTVDSTFGTAGIARFDFGTGIEFTGGTPPTTSLIADTSWGLGVLPTSGRVVIFGSTPTTTAGFSDGDYVIGALTSAGAVDTSFGTNGKVVVDGNGAHSFDNPRHLTVLADESIIATGYNTAGGATSPVLIKTNAAGVLDASFGTNGLATNTSFGAVAESYKVDVQSDGKIVAAGYGRVGAAGTVDLIAYRFNANGTPDATFGTGGITRIDLAGQDDRARNLIVLPDDRIVIVGSSKLDATNVDGFVVLLTKNGALDTSFNGTGYVLRELGGLADSWYGVARAGDKVWISGYKGVTTAQGGNDDAALARIDLTK